MNELRINDFDVIFLSYDEPNCEQNYADLLTKIPWAKRVHGVKGSDAAHKACADIADTNRFVTVDGDNRIRASLLNWSIPKDMVSDNTVISWCGKNVINHLQYGNGGVKCWPKHIVQNMRTHENADPNNEAAQVDFCWDLDYKQMNECFSDVYNNASERQAWRAGFREGVKMGLSNGRRINKEKLLSNPWRTLHWLYIWCNVGTDVENGIWSIYGARQGLNMTMLTDWDFVNVRDFDWLNTFFDTIKHNDPFEGAKHYGEILRNELDLPISVTPMDAEQSAFFKEVYINPSRIDKPGRPLIQSHVYDIVMITYDEPEADKNFEELKKRFPRAKRMHGIKGIQNAHRAAAHLAETDMFWVVDGDAEIVKDFNFYLEVEDWDKNTVHVWRSKNPVNNLQYGYGGVKLLPTHLTRNLPDNTVDMTTSISKSFKSIAQVSNITKFDVDPFTTWRAAFRECVKLASGTIDRKDNAETEERLNTWCEESVNARFGKFATSGARSGRQFGYDNFDKPDRLRLINDFDWLREQFKNDTNT